MAKDVKAIVFAIITLVISIIMALGGLVFSGWGIGAGFGMGFRGKDAWVFALFVVVLTILRIIILIVVIVGGICGIIWFVLWVLQAAPRAAKILILITFVTLIVAAILYLIVTIVGLVYAILLLAVYNRGFYSGWIGALISFIFCVIAAILVFLTKKFCGSDSKGGVLPK